MLETFLIEFFLALLILVVIFLADYSRRTRKAVEEIAEELEKHEIHIAAHRAAYNALFEEVRKLKKKMNNE